MRTNQIINNLNYLIRLQFILIIINSGHFVVVIVNIIIIILKMKRIIWECVCFKALLINTSISITSTTQLKRKSRHK